MIALNDESVRFRAGWNSARAGVELKCGASAEAYDGYEAYFIEHSPPIPRMKYSGDSDANRANRENIAKSTYLKGRAKNGIK